MGRSILVAITALVGLAILIGGYNQLVMNHGDTTSFVTFLSTMIGLGVPALIAMIKSGQAHSKASEVSDKVDKVASDAADASQAAQQAETNTNGKMANLFEQQRAMLTELDHKLAQHLVDHAQGGS